MSYFICIYVMAPKLKTLLLRGDWMRILMGNEVIWTEFSSARAFSTH